VRRHAFVAAAVRLPVLAVAEGSARGLRSCGCRRTVRPCSCRRVDEAGLTTPFSSPARHVAFWDFHSLREPGR